MPRLYARASTTFQPAPIPSSSRPPEMMSTVAAIFASTAGWRYGVALTSTPNRRRRVAWARAVRVIQPSMQSPSMASVKIG